ncbi:MAG: tripartite tricarboxylate transporter substrate-binding protein [Alphaproteobacteria bacterium]|nr:tripartite tricarboxylate transporter substrate-binding protein [Alphaproteobacteria bacterium]
MTKVEVCILVSSALFGACVMTTPVSADEVADFYKNKRINFVVGYNTGGGYDFYARRVAAFYGRFIPGNPTFLVKNMPGVGSVKAANHLYNTAARDGSVIGLLSQTIPVKQRVRSKKVPVKYDAAKFNWLGRIADEVEVTVVWHTAPVKTIEDAKKTEIILASTTASGTLTTLPTLMNRAAGTKFRIVTGYKGTNGAMLAMERGETQGSGATWTTLKSRRPDWVKKKLIRPLVQYAPKRHPELPDVPTCIELIKDPKARAAAALIASSAEVGRSVMAPPGIPGDRVKALRKAFMGMLNDAKFKADMIKLGGEISPLDGTDLQKIVIKALAAPDDVAALALKYTTVKRKKRK